MNVVVSSVGSIDYVGIISLLGQIALLIAQYLKSRK